ncbi:digestive cysteine proteinase 2-like [Heteronotia binoei]|uniref:digestive cysteine proteinase 2-like n=1 Tax=Heteronotia binoei TaxID=13085 RepID=UPI00292DE156|nr:digestive cysteine proteinase 2-like [Heteronotia binoei]
MKTFGCLLALCLWSLASGTTCNVSSSNAIPNFGNIYHVKGVINLPYAEIEEPFEAWYNLTGNKSRIEYYEGQVVTLQLGCTEPFGTMFKLTPETTEKEVNTKKCFQLNGTKEGRVEPQTVFPNMEGYKPIGEEYFKGIYCTVWRNISYWGKKKNIYTMWVTNSSCGVSPVHYEMKGYNTLLGSHYDKYEIDYTDYSNSFPASIFVLKPNETKLCSQLPGESMEHRILANPMADFVGGEEDRAHQLFHHYRKRFGKIYDNETEMEHRKHTFTHNMRFVHSKNRANLSFKLALNHLADLTQDEVAAMRGKLKSTTPNNGHPFPHEQYIGLILPESIDWRLYGAVTPVKDQAVCGSCWSFASTGALEGALFLKTGQLIPLSQQVLIDCSWGFGNYACDGGEEWQAYEWVLKHGGIATTESYGPYKGQNGYCHSNKSELVAKLSHYVNVTSGNITALKAAIYKQGPVAVSIDAAHRTFSFYSSGVYYEPKCGNKRGELDHAVLAVGYGVLQGELYWLIKNSWSTYWGNDGYILMSMKDNNCGVATDATYPVVA